MEHSRQAAADAQRARSATEPSAVSTAQAVFDDRPQAVAQRASIQAVLSSPRAAAQASQIQGLFGGGRRHSAAADGPVQRVETGLISGLDAAVPSTYDTGGGHSYADHGAHTTKEQQVARVNTGIAASGRASKVPKGKPSSKFASDAAHILAFSTAWAGLKEKNKELAAVKGAANVIDVAGAGTLYYADGTEEASSKVALDIPPVDATTVRVNSMYPVKG